MSNNIYHILTFLPRLSPLYGAAESLLKPAATLELHGSLLVGLAPRLGQENVDEDQAEDTDAAVQKEGSWQAKTVLEVVECLGDEKPAEVGGDVGDGVGPAPGLDGQDLRGHHPGEAAQAQVESDGEDHEEREGQPGDLVQQWTGPVSFFCLIASIVLLLHTESPVLLIISQVLSQEREVGTQGNLWHSHT